MATVSQSQPLSRRSLFSRGLKRSALAGMAALGIDLQPAQARAWALRIAEAQQFGSVCPYCAVGCDTMIYVKDGTLLNIEGDANSPINQGTLCPKGAATLQLAVNPHRLTTVKYRAPFSDHWEDRPLDWAMERIAQLVKRVRDETFEEHDRDGTQVMRTFGIGHFGGATLDNEENYLIKKLFSGGLGIIGVENQARI